MARPLRPEASQGQGGWPVPHSMAAVFQAPSPWLPVAVTSVFGDLVGAASQPPNPSHTLPFSLPPLTIAPDVSFLIM